MRWYENSWLLWSGLWLLLVLIPLLNRTFLQIDETRYVTVAWEMWLHGEWLVPVLNGEVYHHKPPLLFWLIMMGWSIFGVNEWWPRLIPGFFSLGSLWLSVYLARLLWPQWPMIARLTPFILLSCLPWSLFTSAVMFDMMLAFFTLLGLVALVLAWQTATYNNHQNHLAWGLFSLAIGLGTLTKGPVILLHLLPVALLAPWWQQVSFSSSWYLRLAISVILGALLALAWAIPAGLAGGEAFREAIFWGQTANRLVNSFAHQHPPEWYLLLLPILLFPWFFWLPTWRVFKHLPHIISDSGVRLTLVWFVIVFFSFSLISGKQLHYLLPILPAFALLTAYLLTMPQKAGNSSWDTVLLGLIIFSFGGLLLGVLLWSLLFPLAVKINWLSNFSPTLGIILLLIGAILITESWLQRSSTLLLVSVASILFNLILPLGILQAAGKAYDLHEISQRIYQLQENQQTIVHFGDYHGQYQFLGRLKQPLPVIDEYTICPWLTQKNENSQVVIYLTENYQSLKQQADYVQAYRSKEVAIIEAQFLLNACVKVMPVMPLL